MAVMSASHEYPQKHLISAEEYLRMGEGGVFAPDARLELIEGEIIEMAPIDPPHAACVSRLHELVVHRASAPAIVWGQNPVIVSDRSVPQPDLALLRRRADYYSTSHPGACSGRSLVDHRPIVGTRGGRPPRGGIGIPLRCAKSGSTPSTRVTASGSRSSE